MKTLIIEGLAAYGQSLYPCFVEPGESIDRHELAEDQQYQWRLSHQYRQEISRPPEMPWDFEDRASAGRYLAKPDRSQTVSPIRIATVTSALIRFWSRLRREQKQWALIEMLHSLDDRTLNDIGIPRGQIEYAVRRGHQDE
jgi:uncharacterized protein YjiS (DUF1127 family)